MTDLLERVTDLLLLRFGEVQLRVEFFIEVLHDYK